MLALSLLALAGLASAATDPRYQFIACNAEEQQKCQAQFNDNAGIDRTLGIAQYQDITQQLQQVWALKGAEGQRITCDAFKQYKNCFSSPNGYMNCANDPLGLLADANGTATGITLEQAYGYTKIFNQNDFVCASGFPQFANNEACGVQVFKNNMADLQKCDTAFYANTKASGNDPALICGFVDIAKNCVQAVFKKACSNVPALQWWGCQWERSGTQTNFPQCTQIYCTMNEGQVNQ